METRAKKRKMIEPIEEATAKRQKIYNENMQIIINNNVNDGQYKSKIYFLNVVLDSGYADNCTVVINVNRKETRKN